MDLFTTTGLIISLIVVVLVFYIMWYSHKTTQQRLKRIAEATMALQGNNNEKELCAAIHEIDAYACPLLDYSIETKDGKTQIGKWHANSPKPTKEQLKTVLQKLKNKMEASI